MDIHPKMLWGRYLPIGFVLLAFAALAVDIPIAGAFQPENQSETAAAYLKYCNAFEVFGHAAGVLLLMIVIHQLDPRRRWAIPRLLACAFAGGILADIAKMLIARTRPYAFNFDGSVWTTFVGWFPCFCNGSSSQSFPSAHTAVATALAGALLGLYPNGRWLFPILAMLAGFQRIESQHHFPSDVLFGAALGCLAVQQFLYGGCFAQWFDAWESKWRHPAPTSNSHSSSNERSR
jgi:undecaprenyl-diphosphatase